MGHGKETPRQKMIGMMYLVLTAMLALNVSAEVLDAFALVEEGLVQTAENFSEQTSTQYNKFAEAAEINEAKAGKWRDKANVVKAKSQELRNYIQDLKIEVVTLADGEDAEAINGDEIIAEKIKNKGDTNVGGQILVGPNNNGKGYDLKEKIESFRKDLNDLFEDDDKVKYAKLIETINKNLDTQDPPISEDGNFRTWVNSRFDQIPAAAVLPQLTSLQVGIINSEAEILSYLLGQINEGSFSFNVIEPNVIPTSNYVIKGNKYNAVISMAAYDSTQSPKVYIGQYSEFKDESGNTDYEMVGKYDSLEVINGKANLSVIASRIGLSKYSGLIVMQRPDGGYIKKPFSREYEVAEPNVVVSPEKMNVFYKGVENPVSVSVAGVPASDISTEISNGSIKRVGNLFTVLPSKVGKSEVKVFATIDGKKQLIETKNFRVKPVPDPFAQITGFKGKNIARMDLLSARGISVNMPEWFDFDLSFNVVSFKVSVIKGGFVEDYTTDGSAFNDRQKSLLKSVSRGTKVFIENIKVKGPDGELREINDIVLTVK